jgi:anti-anti-sigma factor
MSEARSISDAASGSASADRARLGTVAEQSPPGSPPGGSPAPGGVSAAQASGDGRPETPLQRVDRNLEEMTGELRVVVTGVQVLFAFLLILPFNTGFVGVGPFERGVYLATLLCSVFAALCTLAPAAYHRLLFRTDDKRHVVFLANGLSIARLAFLALAMCGSLLLVTTKIFGVTTGAVTAALVAVPFAGLWFVAPLLRRAKREPAAEACAERREPAPATPAPIGHWSPEHVEHAPPDPGRWGKALRYDAGVGAQEHLRVDARRTDERVVLHLTGELDLASSPIFERALEDADVAAAPLLVLDLDELKFVDSTGLRVILLANEGSRARGQEFAITPGSPQVQRLLSITSVAEHMRVLSAPDDPAV